MIYIERPSIKKTGDEVFLKAVIKDTVRNEESTLWFSVAPIYSDFFCEDRLDSFLLVALMIGMKSHQDICLNAPVSKKLLFNIENTIQPLFLKMIPDSKLVKIEAQAGFCTQLRGTAVGCGCSLGVDSLSALYRHLGESVISGYNVTHLALFNSGQLGYTDNKKNELTFKKAVSAITPFAKEVNLPIVAINTNINEIFLQAGYKTAVSRFIISTICCPLALQGLFGKYIFASSYSIENFYISQTDQSHCEAAFVPLLSTESTEIILSSSVMTRVEKTDYIRKFELTSRYLDVCWAEQMASSADHNETWVIGKTKLNCGWCDKCLRTLFTLELLGENLEKYSKIFELSQYYQHKNEFVETVLLHDHENVMYKEISDLMNNSKYPVPKSIRTRVRVIKIRLQLISILKFVYKSIRKIITNK